MVSITSTMLLVLAFVVINGDRADGSASENYVYEASKMPELKYYDKYDELKATGKFAVVYPIITQSAYDWKGIHDFYAGYCDSCTTAELHTAYEKTYSASGSGYRILEFLGYEVLDDIDIDKNPEILKNYEKIVILHNEFVTEREFRAITAHPNVVYLYPNALTSKVEVDHASGLITLVRGPSYPDSDTKSGFDWKHDNSEFFTDWDCHSWEFYPVENGHMLNCYPETFLPGDGYEMLKALRAL